MNFNLRRRIVLPVVALIVSALIYFSSGQIFKKPLAEVSFAERYFSVSAELAITPEEQQIGLMYRKKMDRGSGMLFVFEDEVKRNFWMKNTKIPLDIIFIGSDQKIVDIKGSFEPCLVEVCPSYQSNTPARYVLEVNSGLAWEKGLKIGDKAEIRIK